MMHIVLIIAFDETPGSLTRVPMWMGEQDHSNYQCRYHRAVFVLLLFSSVSMWTRADAAAGVRGCVGISENRNRVGKTISREGEAAVIAAAMAKNRSDRETLGLIKTWHGYLNRTYTLAWHITWQVIQTEHKYKMRRTPNRQHPPLQPKPLGRLGWFLRWEYIRGIELGSP